MLASARKWWSRWWPHIVTALGVLLVMVASTYAASYEDCAANYHKQYSDPEKPHSRPEVPRTFREDAAIFFECEGEFVHTNEGIIMAFATIAIAFFTLALWRSTERLWEAGERQFELANKQFLATHRPEIILLTFSEIEDTANTEGPQMGAEFVVVNKGTASGTILKIETAMKLCDRLPTGIPLEDNNISATPIASGVKKSIPVYGGPLGFAIVKYMNTELNDPTFWCVGRIEYSDIEGRRRETGFCCSYNRSRRCWERQFDPNYEYSY